jgi:Tfp pilus assembly protein PilF
MNNFCGECGYNIESQHKFCPNCGKQLGVKSKADNSSTSSNTDKIIVCDNCGEDNTITNSVCSSCGVKLKGAVSEQKNVSSEKVNRKAFNKSNVRKKVSREPNHTKSGKDLDSKKIILISSTVIIILVVFSIYSGVFDSGVNQNQQQVNKQLTDSGVDLSNINMITDLENKVTTNPADKNSIIQLANLLQDSGLYEKAITYYKKYLVMEPKDANAMVDMGICFYNLNDFQTAITEMEAALKSQPDHQLAHLNLGIVNLSAGNVQVSKEWFSKALELDPNSAAGKRAKELLQSH